jgi:hypothetical protein
VGGLVGVNTGTVTDAYWDRFTTGQLTSAGSADANGLLTVEVTGLDAFTKMVGFNDTTVWQANPSVPLALRYPTLQANAQRPPPQLNLFTGGDGTETNPYQIATWSHLDNTRQVLTANYTLGTDLNEDTVGYDSVVNTTDGFDPIGDSTTAFTGTFNGSSHTISELYNNRSTEDYVGLFGNVSGGSIKNVALEKSNITGDEFTGSLVGENNGTVTDSSATGTVIGTNQVGGLVGQNDGTVITSSATTNVTGEVPVGGLVGDNDEGTVTTSSATGNVTGDASVGGLVGIHSGIVNASYATGDVTGIGNGAGGLIGRNQGTVTDVYATSTVTGASEVGSLVGGNSGTITDSYAIGSTNGTTDVGGLVGLNDGTVTDAYWDVDTIGQSESAGDATGVTTSDLKGNSATSSTVFDFTTWSVLDNGTHVSYPYLQTNPQQPEPGIEQLEPSAGDSGSSSGGGDSRLTVEVTPQNTGEPTTDDSPDSTSVTIRGVRLDERVRIDLSDTTGIGAEDGTTADTADTASSEEGGADADPSGQELRNVLPDGLDIIFKRGGDYELDVTAHGVDIFTRQTTENSTDGLDISRPDLSTNALDNDSKRFVIETNQRPVGFINVETNFDSADAVETATHRFRVRKSYLAATGAAADSVQLYRDELDGWRSLPTRQTDEDAMFHYFEADTPGFSVFAIGTSAPVFEVGAAALASFDETTGAITATVSVENIGSESGVFEARLTANGTAITAQTVTIGTTDITEITVAGVLTTSGSATLELAGRSIGTVTCRSEKPLATESEDNADASGQVDTNEPDSTETSSGFGIWGLGLLLTVVLGSLLVIIIRRRRDDEE